MHGFCAFIGGERFFKRISALGKFAPDIDFNEYVCHDACARAALCKLLGELVAVKGVNKIGLSDEIFDFVCLQMPDKVTVSAADEVKLVAELLNFVFANVSNSCLDRLVDLLRGARLGCRNQRDFFTEAVSCRNFA